MPLSERQSKRTRARRFRRAFVCACLGLAPFASAMAATRLAVSLLQDASREVRVRVRVPAAVEPDLGWSGTARPAPYRLVLVWRGTSLELQQPLPEVPPEGFGPVLAMTLRSSAGESRLELLLDRAVQPSLRRVGDAWELRLPVEAAAAGQPAAPPPVQAGTTLPAPTSEPAPAAVVAPAAIALAPATAAAAAPAPRAPKAPARDNAARPELLLLDVKVNGQAQAEVARAEVGADGLLLLAEAAWTQARLANAGERRALGDGTPAFVLDQVAGLTYRLDRGSLALEINAPASAFVGSRLGPQGPVATPPHRPEPGFMLNYDVSLARMPGDSRPTGGAWLEAVAFNGFGTVVSSALLSDDGTRRSFDRLDSYWRYDMPERMETLVVGDTIGVSGGWSRPARYAGVRWGRDFGMRPGFVTMPQVSLAGEAALPSTVEVLVNNARRISQPVAPGPFDLTNVPVVTGAGELNLVVRDLLGRETIVKQSYYASPRLLAPGLTDFSLEAGWLRTGYGRDSEYGDAFAAGTLRAGLTPQLTGEARVEVQPDRRAGGVELSGLVGDLGAARVALAASSGRTATGSEQGQMVQLGFERSTPTGGGSLQYEYATRGFAPFGEATDSAAPQRRARERWLANVGGSLWGPVSGGLSYVRQKRWDGDKVEALSLFASAPLGLRATISVSVQKRLDGDRGWSAGVNVSMPLENGVHTAARVERDVDGRVVGNASAAKNPPSGPGLGWRVEASTQESQRARAGLQYNTSISEMAADVVSDAKGRLAVRAGARGTLGLVGGVPFASRPVGEGSVAVVEVEGLPGVPVKRSNQVVAHTDTRGRAVVPGLLPWQKNQIEIDPGDLPLDVELGETIQDVTPYPRSGSVIRFAVRRTRQALLVLHQPDGQPVPVGTEVQLGPQGPVFTAGRRGEVWLTDLAAQSQRVQVRWPSGACELELDVPAAADGMPGKIGPLVCGATK